MTLDAPAPHLPGSSASHAPPAPNWKPIRHSRGRTLLHAVIGLALLAAIVVGSWFTYQSLAPADGSTTPTTLLVDNPDTFVGKASDLVDQVNDNEIEEELLEQLGVDDAIVP